MFYPYDHTYPWDELYYRFLRGKIALADWRLNQRWDEFRIEPNRAIDDIDDDRYDRLNAIASLCFPMSRRRLPLRRCPHFDAIVLAIAVSNPTTISRLGDDLRRARADLPSGWLSAAVAIAPDASPTMVEVAQRREVHIITPHGLHTPYHGPIPPAFRL